MKTLAHVKRKVFVLYVSPAPIPIGALRRTFNARLSKGSLVSRQLTVYPYGKIEVTPDPGQDPKQLLRGVVSKARRAVPSLSLLAIGAKLSDGRLSIYVANRRYVSQVLGYEIEATIRDLGLFSEKTEQLSSIVANEMLCRVVVKNDWDDGSLILEPSSTSFTGMFVIDDKMRQRMVRAYLENARKYLNALNRNNGNIINRLLQKLGFTKKDILNAIVAAIIVEATIRFLVSLVEIGHSEAEELQDVTHLRPPPSLLQKLEDADPFTAAEIAREDGLGEFQVLEMLTTLRKLRIVTIVNRSRRVYRATGKRSIPILVASIHQLTGTKAMRSDLFARSRTMFRRQIGQKIETGWEPDLILPYYSESLKKFAS